jgi:tetratricopeptide (TPR) repeat protein
LIARAAGDTARADQAYRSALPIAQKQVNHNPNFPGPLFLLAATLANLGRKEEALAIANQMAGLVPLEKNHQSALISNVIWLWFTLGAVKKSRQFVSWKFWQRCPPMTSITAI